MLKQAAARLEGQGVAGALSRGNCGGAAFQTHFTFTVNWK
jgi:hypothetical protein